MESYAPMIRDLPPSERPRERLMNYGASSLSTAELLAIILRTGTQKESAVRLAERVLKEMGSLREIVRADVKDLSKIKGIGTAKAIEIKAAVELGKRLLIDPEGLRPVIRNPEDAASLVRAELRYEPQEHFKVLLLDSKNYVLKVLTVTVGTLNSSLVHPREVFRPAITQSAASVILAHNHPSGDPTPSPEDLQVTRQLVEAGRILGIEVLDHIIIGGIGYVSLKERRLM